MKRQERFFAIVGSAALWGLLVVPVFATVVVFGKGDSQTTNAMFAFVLIFIAVPSAFLSVVGAVLLALLGRDASSRLVLSAEAAFLGAILSLPFGISGTLFFKSLLVGGISAAAYAFCFNKLFLTPPEQAVSSNS